MWSDYQWVEEHWLFSGVTLSVVSPATTSLVLASLPKVLASQPRTIDDLDAPWPGISGPHAVVGVIEHRTGTIVVEIESSASEPTMLALSTGRRAATYYVGGHGGGRFTWYESGTVKCSFDHDIPEHRSGSDPDAVVPFITAIGGFSGVGKAIRRDAAAEHHPAAAIMALLERLSGVDMPQSLILDSTYLALCLQT